jgi:YebC/PmpR family DNA-binding regulatory protein
MSGHSKWATIKRQKGVADVKRGMVFTKLANAIIIAVREGGGITDPESNFKLRLSVDRARSMNMPKENIERAIERATGAGKDSFNEVLYEGFAPGGAAVIVEAVTDNKLRTTSEVKNIIERNGGTMATPGAVGYLFQQKGEIVVEKNGKSFEDIFMVAAEGGAEDVEDVDGQALVYTEPGQLRKVKDFLSENQITVKDAELTRKPLNTVLIEDPETAKKMLAFMEKLEEMDDVQKVYSNFDIPDTVLEQADLQ